VPDSAYAQYIGILDNYPQNKFEARTMYALGSYYLTVNNKEKADSLFLEIYENHNYDPVANAAAEKLGLSKIVTDIDPAEQKYVRAEDLYLNNEFESAIDSLYEISRKYPNSPLAPKSLYTIGWILENDLKMPDSAATVYDTLISKYKRTEYASSVTKKLNAYRAWEAEYQDSIMQIEQARLDSLRADSLSNAGAVTDSAAVADSISIADTTSVTDSIGTRQTSAEDSTSAQDTLKTPQQDSKSVKEDDNQPGGNPNRAISDDPRKAGSG
jgi:outer membrane protein assembly factor BamD (BamD/ComL family)